MILENFSELGIIVLVCVVAPMLYAWADRWLDRTRNKTSDSVISETKED